MDIIKSILELLNNDSTKQIISFIAKGGLPLIIGSIICIGLFLIYKIISIFKK